MTTPLPATRRDTERTYTLKQIVIDIDNKTRHGRTHYITVSKGLTWWDAKTRRNANRKARLFIVPERNGAIGGG